MAIYLVKATQTEKDGNERISWYYGKDQKLLKSEGHKAEDSWLDFDWINEHTLNEYGYKRLCDAKRSYSFKNAHDTEKWVASVEIVTYGMFG